MRDVGAAGALIPAPPTPFCSPRPPATAQNGAPVFGVVHVPVGGKTYWGLAGAGAWRRDTPTAVPVRLQCASFSLEDEGLTVVGSASHASAETAEFLSVLKAPSFKGIGSSLKLLMVAEGTAHVYPRLAPTCGTCTLPPPHFVSCFCAARHRSRAPLRSARTSPRARTPARGLVLLTRRASLHFSSPWK